MPNKVRLLEYPQNREIPTHGRVGTSFVLSTSILGIVTKMCCLFILSMSIVQLIFTTLLLGKTLKFQTNGGTQVWVIISFWSFIFRYIMLSSVIFCYLLLSCVIFFGHLFLSSVILCYLRLSFYLLLSSVILCHLLLSFIFVFYLLLSSIIFCYLLLSSVIFCYLLFILCYEGIGSIF